VSDLFLVKVNMTVSHLCFEEILIQFHKTKDERKHIIWKIRV